MTDATSTVSNPNASGALMKSYREAGRAVTVGKRFKGYTLIHSSPNNTQLGNMAPHPINNPSAPSVPVKYQRVIRQPRKHEDGFGLRKPRFKPNYKKIFNPRDPGPGSHDPFKSSQISKSTILDAEGNPQFGEPSHSRKGYGVGFASEDERFKQHSAEQREMKLKPGPGNYDPVPVKPKARSCVIRNKAAFSLPFNQNNPLNYVKPLTVNIYFKSEIPGPGVYNPKRAEVHQNLHYHAAFKSKSQRNEYYRVPDNPPVGLYQLDNAEFIKHLKEKDIPSSNFRKPTGATRVKVNLYDPHSELKDPAEPGPGHYDSPDQNDGTFKFKNNQFWSQFVVTEIDRFGEQLKHKTPYQGPPGPGAYTHELVQPDIGYYDALRAAFNSSVDRSKMANISIKGNKTDTAGPGPAYYVPEKEAKKISFHLNAEKKFVVS